MRWLAALAAGSCIVLALFAAVYGYKSFEDWQSSRTELVARIALLEKDPGRPNRDGNLAAARQLLDLANGVVVEKVGTSALGLVLALAAFLACYRYASRLLTPIRLVAVAVVGAATLVAISILALLVLGAAAIRG